MGVNDIKSARRISRAGTIVIAFNDLKPGSPYFQLVASMKTKGANPKDANLYANIMLTPQCSTMLYHIRKAHKEQVLDKYFCD